MVDNITNQKMDLPPEALNVEKLAALVAMHLDVAPVELQLMPIAIWCGQDEQKASSFKQESLALAGEISSVS